MRVNKPLYTSIDPPYYMLDKETGSIVNHRFRRIFEIPIHRMRLFNTSVNVTVRSDVSRLHGVHHTRHVVEVFDTSYLIQASFKTPYAPSSWHIGGEPAANEDFTIVPMDTYTLVVPNNIITLWSFRGKRYKARTIYIYWLLKFISHRELASYILYLYFDQARHDIDEYRLVKL